MKYLFTIIFISFSLFVIGQSTKEYKKEKKEVVKGKLEETKALSDDLELDKANVDYYRQFDRRRQELQQIGVPSREIRNDAQIQGLHQVSQENYSETFEYNMTQYVYNGQDISQGSFLLKAYELNPNEIGTLDEVLEYASWKNDMTLEKEVAAKIRSSSKYDAEIYNYSRDLLSSIPSGSVLITSGEIETISGKVLQINDGIYKGVTVIKKDWLDQGRYSASRLKEMGLNVFELTEDPLPNIHRLIESNPQKKFYLSLTLPKEDLQYLKDRLFLVGLAYQYSTSPIENLETIEKNWKKIYADKNVESVATSHFGKKLLSNYLLSGIKLYYYHIQKGENGKANKLKAKLYEMALISGHSEKLKAWL